MAANFTPAARSRNFRSLRPEVSRELPRMAQEFGWWEKDPEAGKFQVVARIHGGNIAVTRKQGHFQPWIVHTPSEADWERLLAEASRRVPRRLISPKQFADIQRIVDAR